jgi:tRNA threonylcarbamoyl adenosine modification protein YjeE
MIIYNNVTTKVQETLSIANNFANKFLIAHTAIKICSVVYLIGNLGAGKTTFMQGLLTSLGVNEPIKSPTYTILESYQNLKVPVYHFDLYRLTHPRELELIGIRDFLHEQAICCFEWPGKGANHIPDPDFSIELDIVQEDIRTIKIHYFGNPYW